MFLLRILGVLTAVGIGAGIVAFLFTQDRRYLRLAWRIAKYALIFSLLFMGLLTLERFIAF